MLLWFDLFDWPLVLYLFLFFYGRFRGFLGSFCFGCSNCFFDFFIMLLLLSFYYSCWILGVSSSGVVAWFSDESWGFTLGL